MFKPEVIRYISQVALSTSDECELAYYLSWSKWENVEILSQFDLTYEYCALMIPCHDYISCRGNMAICAVKINMIIISHYFYFFQSIWYWESGKWRKKITEICGNLSWYDFCFVFDMFTMQYLEVAFEYYNRSEFTFHTYVDT